MADALALLADPECYAHRYVEGDDSFRFIRLPRARHGEAAFLTDEYLGETRVLGDVSAAQCLTLPNDEKLHFLFHSAFCGSTMLTRALDIPGIAMGMSEPVTLNDVVGFRRRRADPRAVARTADAAMRLLARPFAEGEAVVIKPSNVINSLAELLMMLRPSAKAVFLYAPLETFLVSVARKGLACRLWVRELLEGLILENAVELGFSSEDYFRLTDLQVAAVGWLAQHRSFARLAGKLGSDRLASLDADLMLARPVEALVAVAQHYGLPINLDLAAGIAAGPTFTQHSKSGEAYSSAKREADYAAIRAAHGDEISTVVAWATKLAEAAGVTMAAPNPLLQSA
jgi:hypothetical protein